MHETATMGLHLSDEIPLPQDRDVHGCALGSEQINVGSVQSARIPDIRVNLSYSSWRFYIVYYFNVSVI